MVHPVKQEHLEHLVKAAHLVQADWMELSLEVLVQRVHQEVAAHLVHLVYRVPMAVLVQVEKMEHSLVLLVHLDKMALRVHQEVVVHLAHLDKMVLRVHLV